MGDVEQLTGDVHGVLDDLRPYQKEGVAFFVRHDSALLADEMGLGKTVQTAVALDLCLRQPGIDRALIVTPASLRLNWERELARWAPNVTVRRVSGSAVDRAAYYMLPVPVLIASYEQVRADMPNLAPSLNFDLVILDEAQRIKNRHSSTALGCQIIPRKRSWALTGTPVENSPSDLVSVFEFVRPGLLRDWQSRMEMHDRIEPYFLRRRKDEVLPEMPPILIQDIPLELRAKQRIAYEELWNGRVTSLQAEGVPVSEVSMLALITRLKQVCNFDDESDESVKLESLKLVLDGLSGPTAKVLIFSQFVETLTWLSTRLGSIPNDIFHGGLNETQRDDIVDRFRTEPGPRALLISLRAGGVGLNLQEASTVVMFDRWWNPAIENQAIQRAHRFGRDRPLHVIRFLVTDTIEERISEVLSGKESLIEAYTEQARSADVPHLSRQELRRLLDLPLQDINSN